MHVHNRQNPGHRLTELVRQENGPTSVEYAFLLALILMVTLGSITLLGTVVNNLYAAINEAAW